MADKKVALTPKGFTLAERMLELEFNGATKADSYAQAMREFGMRRREVMSNSNNLESWRAFANYAIGRGRYHDAQVAYYYLIAREPDHHDAYNQLAWLLLTVDDSTFRDPPRALALAEEAYALAPLPHIIDTLAEAAFQNGDHARAIRLEKEAIAHAESEDDRAFYQGQLARFERGPEMAPTAVEATPTIPSAPPDLPRD